jgi:hypothetical protein
MSQFKLGFTFLNTVLNSNSLQKKSMNNMISKKSMNSIISKISKISKINHVLLEDPYPYPGKLGYKLNSEHINQYTNHSENINNLKNNVKKVKKDKKVKKVKKVKKNKNIKKLEVVVSPSIIPSNFTLPYLPENLEQGDLGDCVTNSMAFAIAQQTNSRILLSRIDLYQLCLIDNKVAINNDVGTTIETVCRMVKNYGLNSESLFPYNISNFGNFQPLSYFTTSILPSNYDYIKINPNINDILTNLQLFPIIVGIAICPSFTNKIIAKTGDIPMPNPYEKVIGGHAITLTGYNNDTQRFSFANWWGNQWGNSSYGTIPYAYILRNDLCNEIYAIKCN